MAPLREQIVQSICLQPELELLLSSKEGDPELAIKMEIDISKVCRLCLKGGEVMCPIFGSSQLNGNTASLPHRIMACAQVKVFEGDGLPANVCTSCLSQVDRCYQFRLMCEKTDSMLRGNMQGRSSPSDEDEVYDGTDAWDMTKFTPEVIINEEGDENSVETNGGEVVDGYYPLSQVEAILRHHGTEIKMQADNVILPITNGFEAYIQTPQPPLPQSVVLPDQPPLSTPGPSPKSRRCRGGDKLFKCRQCNKSYSFSSALSRHKAVHNTALRPHVCNICNKGFTQLDKLLRHQKTHSLDMVMTCEQCGRSFKTFATYQRHRLLGNCTDPGSSTLCEKCDGEIQPGENHSCNNSIIQAALASPPLPLALAVVPVNLTTNSQVTNETKNEEPTETENKSPPPQLKSLPPAPQCSSSPPSSDIHQTPANSRTNKGKPEFKCNVCQKNFATRGSLEVHSTIHTGVRPFVCSVCQKSFRHKVNLMEHFQRKHSQVRPYICDVCAARFVTKQELVRHYRKHIGD